jgi:hypothetical protein
VVGFKRFNVGRPLCAIRGASAEKLYGWISATERLVENA